jgi:hypothetical protein
MAFFLRLKRNRSEKLCFSLIFLCTAEIYVEYFLFTKDLFRNLFLTIKKFQKAADELAHYYTISLQHFKTSLKLLSHENFHMYVFGFEK